jgi:hypothetical protein
MTPLRQLVKAIAWATEALTGLVWALICFPPRAFRQWRTRTAQDRLEAERLDRIRNPSKYLGQ